MVGAIAATFAGPLGLGDAFILENVRYELLIVSIFIILFSGFILPTANLAGTHGPLIPLIPIVVAAGGHPMAFGLLIGGFGLLLAISKGGSLLANLTSKGVCGGLLLYLGFIGTTSQVKNLFAWAEDIGMAHIAFVVILLTIILYALLEHFSCLIAQNLIWSLPDWDPHALKLFFDPTPDAHGGHNRQYTH